MRFFIDQYGQAHLAKTLKELKQELRGKVSIMYQDKKNGSIARVGYVVGNLWLCEYSPVETIIKGGTK